MNSWNPIAFVRQVSRNSPWVVMAVALHLIVLAVAAVFVSVQRETGADSDAPRLDIRRHDLQTVEQVPEPPKIIRDKIPQPDAPLISDADPLTPIDPNSKTDPEDAGLPDSPFTTETGGDLSSTAIGPGKVGQTGKKPTSFWSRVDGHHKVGEGPSGPFTRTETAVLEGLRWLARHQNPDGSWGVETSQHQCTGGACFETKPRAGAHFDEGLTGMALLAFLGSGYSHESPQYFQDPVSGKTFRVGEVVKNGLLWLVQRQNEDGSFERDRPFMYNEALAAMAVCEDFGLSQSRYFRAPAQKAVDFVQAAQRPSPLGTGLWGWRYASRQDVERFHQGDTLDDKFKRDLYDADLSATGWCVMALKSAQLAGLKVSTESMDGALAFTKWLSTDDGRAGYLDPKSAGAKVTGVGDEFVYHTATMSALSMCVRAFTAHDAADPFLDAAAKQVAADLPKISKDHLSLDYYYWYYGSLALNQFDGPDSPHKAGGKLWGAWNKAMVDAVLGTQSKGVRDCSDGGWIVGDRWANSGGPVYSTAINVLTLEVYYRYENAFGAGKSIQGQAKPK